MTDDQKPEELEPGTEEPDAGTEGLSEEAQASSGAMSCRIVGWALNKIAEEAESECMDAGDALKAVAQYQLSIAAHRIADNLSSIHSALTRIAQKIR